MLSPKKNIATLPRAQNYIIKTLLLFLHEQNIKIKNLTITTPECSDNIEKSNDLTSIQEYLKTIHDAITAHLSSPLFYLAFNRNYYKKTKYKLESYLGEINKYLLDLEFSDADLRQDAISINSP